MTIPTLVELAESGAHFGHHRSLTFPKAKPFIYMVKSNVALINLEKTQNAIETAQKTISDYNQKNKSIMFVGTKRSVRGVVKEVAEAIGASYITERWFGGMLTNFSTIKENIKRMNELEEFLASPEAAKLSKKDRLERERRLHRYQRFLKGISTMKGMPDLIILASASDDAIAIEEAEHLHIPVMAITDTDMNPTRITYPIPANDDAPKAIELILRSIIEVPGAKKAAVKAEEATAEVADEEPEAVEATEVDEPVAEKAPVKKTTTKAKK